MSAAVHTPVVAPKKHASQGSMPSNRSRASVACQNCRLRKVKCDSQSLDSGAPCTPCRRARQECRLDPTSDGRRSASRKYYDELQQRIQILEARARHNSDTDIPDVIINLDDGVIGEPRVAPPHSPESSSTASHHADQGGRDQAPAAPAITSTASNASTSSTASSKHNGRTRSQKSPSSVSVSFFGLTSHPHVTSSFEQTQQATVDDALVLGIDVDITSPNLKNHLLLSFFKYQSLWVDVVNKDCFFTHRSAGVQSRWYNSFLEYTILACATRLSTSNAVRSLGPQYVRLASAEVLGALHEPTPASLQAFLLLSEYEVTLGNDRPGWMYCGIACRMVSDLGLHDLADINSAPDESEETACGESASAYALLSSCIVYEGVWTLYLGRPSSIPKSVTEIAAIRCKARRKVDSPMLNAWLSLCMPMAEISRVLNDQSAGISDASSLHRLAAELQEWYDSLIPELVYDENNLMTLDMSGYGLHSQYCKLQILLRQAISTISYPRKRRYSQLTNEEDVSMMTKDTKESIYQSCLRIARLVVTYREIFGVEKIPSILLDNAIVATTGLIQHFFQKANSVDEQRRDFVWIQSLMKSMQAVQQHFPITQRMLDALKNITEGSSLSSLLRSSSPETVRTVISELPPTSLLDDSTFTRNMLQPDPGSLISKPDDIWGPFGMDISPNKFLWGRMDNTFPDVYSSLATFTDFGNTVPD